MTRPEIHFAPEKNWMNDPNGTVFSNGIYHLFYQYNPHGSDWGNICWAYANSRNLIDWQRSNVYLTPQTEMGERYCFSGCAVKTLNGFKIFYTSIGFEKDAVQRHAKQIICDADKNFKHIKRNGFCITADIHNFSVSEWRDPFVFVCRNEYYMVLAGVTDKSHILLYRATDGTLNKWEYVGIFYTPPYDDIAECPNIAVFDDKIVLIYSLVRENIVKYASGTFDGKRFSVKNTGTVDWGKNCFYATNLAYDEKGNYILFGWQKESLINKSSVDGTYSGCLALPRVMLLNGFTPQFRFTNALTELQDKLLPITEEQNKIVCCSPYERARLTFIASADSVVEILSNGREYVILQFENRFARIVRRSLTERADEQLLQAEVCLEQNEVDIVTDGTITEIIINHSAISFRFYRQYPIKTLFKLVSGTVKNIKIYKMKKPNISTVL